MTIEIQGCDFRDASLPLGSVGDGSQGHTMDADALGGDEEPPKAVIG